MSDPKQPILVIADDRKHFLELVGSWAEDAGLVPKTCLDAASALELIEKYSASGELSGVVTDLAMPGLGEGLSGGWDVISHAYRLSKSVRLALFTGELSSDLHGIFTSQAAVPSFRVFLKMGDKEELKLWLAEIRAAWNSSLSLVLEDASTREIFNTLTPMYAKSTLPILIVGEIGTGKKSLASHIHDHSDHPGPLFEVNCRGLEASAAYSELFGQTANAFPQVGQHALGKILEASGYKVGPKVESPSSQSFIDWLKFSNPDLEVKSGLWTSSSAEKKAGTLYLDEIDSFSGNAMAALLRVIETGMVVPNGYHGVGIQSHCRFVAGTTEVDIIAHVNTGTDSGNLRQSLLYRLAGAVFSLSPLRERGPEDLRSYLREAVWAQIDLPKMPVSDAAVDRVVNLYQVQRDAIGLHYQKGNFRSLRNLTHRASLLARKDGAGSIEFSHIELAIKHGDILVPKGIDTQREQIRNTFQHALQRALTKAGKDISIPDNFGLNELNILISKASNETGYAFLKCTTIQDERQFTLTEIEAALRGGKSRSAWIGKALSVDIVCKAAVDYFKIPREEISPHVKSINDVVKFIRHYDKLRDFLITDHS